jgi:lipopolysaccharide/colanic/teichoic acid biosynthesis glycosyltransferase
MSSELAWAENERWQTETLFALCRRHALPFGVLAVRVGESPASETAWQSVAAARRLENQITLELRETDLLVRCEALGQYLIFCPDTPEPGGKELVGRLGMCATEVPIAFGTAFFREDALILPDLIAVARERLSEATPSAGTSNQVRIPNTSLRRRRPSIDASWRRRLQLRVKRIFDVVVVAATAPMWVPVICVIALAIKASHPSWPVFFVQPRTGRGGSRFGMLKFRTMVADAEERKAELMHLNKLSWPDFKVEEDPRITRIGRVLRRTSLDELPQMLNVLRGEMSLVGPRPTSFHADTYEPWQTARLDVVPGLTGLWQVEGRSSTEFDARLRLDLEYIEKQGFFYDLWILLRTFLAVFQMRGSH